MSPSRTTNDRHESRRRQKSYILTPVSIPKLHYITQACALAIIMNIFAISYKRAISIYVKHARFHGVSRSISSATNHTTTYRSHIVLAYIVLFLRTQAGPGGSSSSFSSSSSSSSSSPSSSRSLSSRGDII